MNRKDISHAKGKARLRRNSDKLITRTLKLLDNVWQYANNNPNNIDAQRIALQAHTEIMPYLRPKLQAIAAAEMNEAGEMTPLIRQQIARELADEMSKPLLDTVTVSNVVQDEANP